MGWRMRGTTYESCSCKMICGCTLGPFEPDQGWCSALLVWSVAEGESNGVDLSGAKIAAGAELPGDFTKGVDKARYYLDCSDEQAVELEGILKGDRGGPWQALAGAVREWLPAQRVSIEIDEGEPASVTVGDVGRLSLQPVKGEDGTHAVLENAPVASALGDNRVHLATSTGSGGSDPDMRSWETLGYGAINPFDHRG